MLLTPIREKPTWTGNRTRRVYHHQASRWVFNYSKMLRHDLPAVQFFDWKSNPNAIPSTESAIHISSKMFFPREITPLKLIWSIINGVTLFPSQNTVSWDRMKNKKQRTKEEAFVRSSRVFIWSVRHILFAMDSHIVTIILNRRWYGRQMSWDSSFIARCDDRRWNMRVHRIVIIYIWWTTTMSRAGWEWYTICGENIEIT